MPMGALLSSLPLSHFSPILWSLDRLLIQLGLGSALYVSGHRCLYVPATMTRNCRSHIATRVDVVLVVVLPVGATREAGPTSAKKPKALVSNYRIGMKFGGLF